MMNVPKKTMAQQPKHQGVLVSEVINWLEPKSSGLYLDCTYGGGGHSKAILDASAPSGRVVALDRDPSVSRFATDLQKTYGKRFEFFPYSYENLADLGLSFDGIVFDLGLSTDQLDPVALSNEGEVGRGFSFSREEPLDMRFNQALGRTAAELLRQASLDELVRIFSEYAEDRRSKQLASKIIERRREKPLRTTTDFVEVVGTAKPAVLAPLFQALRIAVNDELSVLKRGLGEATECLKEHGRIAVISFHSLEDRIVKETFRSGPFSVLTKKPIVPSQQEIDENPRSRSAKLRVAEKLN